MKRFKWRKKKVQGTKSPQYLILYRKYPCLFGWEISLKGITVIFSQLKGSYLNEHSNPLLGDGYLADLQACPTRMPTSFISKKRRRKSSPSDLIPTALINWLRLAPLDVVCVRRSEVNYLGAGSAYIPSYVST